MNTTTEPWPARAGMVALLLTLAACGGGEAEAPQPDSTALAVSQPGELASYVQTRLRSQAAGAMVTTAGMPVPAFVDATSSAAPARSGTLLQEPGVDEADLIQSDGARIYTLQPPASNETASRLSVHTRAANGSAPRSASLLLPNDGASNISVDGMVLHQAQRALGVVSQHWTSAPLAAVCLGCTSLVAQQWMRSSVQVLRVDLADASGARAGERIDIDGQLVGTRRIGDWLYVVSTHNPLLPTDLLPSGATAAEREAAIARISAADVLPRMRRNGGASEALLGDTDCYVQRSNASATVQITTITLFDLRSATLARSSRCFVGGSEALYMSPTSLYLATTRWNYQALSGGSGSAMPMLIFPADIRTDIHKFSLAEGSVSYRGSGEVAGHLGWDRERSSLRLSEHNGDLRVLSYTGQQGWATILDATRSDAPPPSPARLSVLRESSAGGSLQTVATLPNAARPAAIGKPGEQVYGVRFAGDRAYVVTFRRIDPLYVLDLSNPADPRTVGEIELAGFSEHLFPLPQGLLLGVGRDADSNGRVLGLKLVLFDVTDAAAPTVRGSLLLGAEGSASALDGSRHGLNLLMQGAVARVALPVTLTSRPYGGWQRGLQRFEVDTAARSLRTLSMVGAVSGANSALQLERSLQIGDQVYYLSAGTLSSHGW